MAADSSNAYLLINYKKIEPVFVFSNSWILFFKVRRSRSDIKNIYLCLQIGI